MFFFSLAYYGYTNTGKANSQNKATVIEANLAEELAIHQSYLRMDLIDITEVAPPENLSILIYEGLKLKKWSSHEFVPEYAELASLSISPAFIENVDGLYLVSFEDRNDQRVYFVTTLIRKFAARRTTLTTYFNDRIFEGIRGEISPLGEPNQIGEHGFYFSVSGNQKDIFGLLIGLDLAQFFARYDDYFSLVVPETILDQSFHSSGGVGRDIAEDHIAANSY